VASTARRSRAAAGPAGVPTGHPAIIFTAGVDYSGCRS